MPSVIRAGSIDGDLPDGGELARGRQHDQPALAHTENAARAGLPDHSGQVRHFGMDSVAFGVRAAGAAAAAIGQVHPEPIGKGSGHAHVAVC